VVYCLSRSQPAFSSRHRKRATGPIGPSSLKKSVGREGIEPPQPKAADLQIDARETPFAAANLRFSEETRMPLREIVRGVRRPTESGSEERPLPCPARRLVRASERSNVPREIEGLPTLCGRGAQLSARPLSSACASAPNAQAYTYMPTFMYVFGLNGTIVTWMKSSTAASFVSARLIQQFISTNRECSDALVVVQKAHASGASLGSRPASLGFSHRHAEPI